MKPGFLDKLLLRLDRLDPTSLQTHILHLAREKGLLETIFNAIQEGLVVVDGDGHIQYANRASQQMLGLPTETTGHSVRRYLRDLDWDLVLGLDEQAWSQLVTREMEIRYPERRFVQFYVVPLEAVDLQVTGAVLIFRDVTREREQEAQTLESERVQALTLLAAGVAHEIGNPLNSLNIHLQLLDRGLRELPENPDLANLQEIAAVARQEVTRLDGILTQFLRALRPARPQTVCASVPEILRETLDFLRHEISDRDVTVDVAVSAELPPAQVDPAQIRQAFFNLIRNAIQAMPNGGQLHIRLSATDRFVAVAFQDTGPGIQPGDLGRLFEPQRTTRPEGSGLGLMIVQRIVRDHGGHVEVRSDPRTGTTFTLFLPRDEQRIRLLKAPRSHAHAEDAATP